MNEFQQLILGLKRGIEAFSKWASTIDWKAIHEVFESIGNQFPADIEQTSISLMNRGWFIWFFEGYMDDFTEKFKHLIKATESEQDLYMKKYVNERIEYIESELCILYPNRSEQIEQAFAAHQAQLYYSSVPVFIALAEGIGKEIFPKLGIFSKQNGEPKTANLINQISGIDILEEAVLKPLKVKSNVTKSIHDPSANDMKSFNRHLIMHGLSDSYGSEINSLKAISLVSFIHESLTFLKDKEKST